MKKVRVVKKRWGRAAGSIFAMSMFVSACGGGSVVRIEIVSGNDQTAQAGTTLPSPVRFRVVDDQDGGVPGMFVHVLTIGEAGRIMRSETGVQVTDFVDTTDALGEGEFFWSLGAQLGEQLASATVVDDAQLPIDGIRSELFRALAGLGPPNIVLPLNGHLGSAEVGTDADPLVVGVYDSLSNPIPGVDVAWAVTAGGGSISDMVSTTDSMGLATTTLTVGPTVVDNRVAVTVANRPPVEFSVIGVNPIADPAGDRVPGAGGVPPDLIAYQGFVIDGLVVFHMRFNQTANSSAVGGSNAVHGFIEIDIDQDPNTGNAPIIDIRPGGTGTGMGIEYRIIIQLQNGRHQVSVLPSGSTVFRAMAAFSGRTITIRVPLSAFGGDDGNMNYGILVGTFLPELGVLAQTAPTDWAPESGWATIVP